MITIDNLEPIQPEEPDSCEEEDKTLHYRGKRVKSTRPLLPDRGKNLHKNLFDLEKQRKAKLEAEAKERHNRLINRWKKAVAEVNEYNEFMDQVKAGKRPSFAELGKLNKLKFNGYS